jgi:SH3-like domain-containing protein
VKFLPKILLRSAILITCSVVAISSVACRHSGGRVLEVAYVSGTQVVLRDRVAAVFEKAGLVKNGDRVEVLDHDRTFVKVRTSTGQMGWMEKRYLVGQQVFDQLQKLTAENANDPVQAQGATRNDTNLHVEPGRDAEHLYQISAGEKLLLLKRGTAERGAPAATHTTSSVDKDKKEGKPGRRAGDKKQLPEQPAPAPPHSTNLHPAIEDWWLVRDSHGRVGWVLARMVDLDVPLDVAQYAEGQRIVAFFVLNQVKDADKNVPQYLIVLTEPKDGLLFDFNQIRVFTWNVRRHRYETAYRERTEGVLPVTVAHEDFGKEGVLPVFVTRVPDETGKVNERKYKLNTPMVRRVYAPGEEQVHTVARRQTARKRKR